MSNTGTINNQEWHRPSRSFPCGMLQFSWTSNSSGIVTYTTTNSIAGTAARCTTVPSGSPSAPTSAYVIKFEDEDGVDVLAGAGTGRHGTNTESVYPAVDAVTGTVQIPFAGLVTLKITGAGDAKKGKATLYYV